jgi:uncharacterized protein (TIGR03083 family)
VSDELDLAGLYQQTMDRITELVSAPGASADAAVAACPGWSVRDVLAHLAGVAQDWAAGRRAAPPTDAQTAAQVARFDGRGVDDILRAWDDAARDALGRPGLRDSAGVQSISDQLLRMLVTPVPVLDHLCLFGPATADLVK